MLRQNPWAPRHRRRMPASGQGSFRATRGSSSSSRGPARESSSGWGGPGLFEKAAAERREVVPGAGIPLHSQKNPSSAPGYHSILCIRRRYIVKSRHGRRASERAMAAKKSGAERVFPVRAKAPEARVGQEPSSLRANTAEGVSDLSKAPLEVRVERAAGGHDTLHPDRSARVFRAR